MKKRHQGGPIGHHVYFVLLNGVIEDRLLDFQNHIGRSKQLLDVLHDYGAGLFIIGVGDEDARAGTSFDGHIKALLAKSLYGFRDGRDALFSV